MVTRRNLSNIHRHLPIGPGLLLPRVLHLHRVLEVTAPVAWVERGQVQLRVSVTEVPVLVDTGIHTTGTSSPTRLSSSRTVPPPRGPLYTILFARVPTYPPVPCLSVHPFLRVLSIYGNEVSQSVYVLCSVCLKPFYVPPFSVPGFSLHSRRAGHPTRPLPLFVLSFPCPTPVNPLLLTPSPQPVHSPRPDGWSVEHGTVPQMVHVE